MIQWDGSVLLLSQGSLEEGGSYIRGCGDEGRVWSDGPGAKEHDDFWKL